MRLLRCALDTNRTGALDNQRNCKMHPADKRYKILDTRATSCLIIVSVFIIIISRAAT